MMMVDMTQLGSVMGLLMFVGAIFRQLFPGEFQRSVRKYVNKVVSYVYPYIEITFHEYQVNSWFKRSKAFSTIECHLSTYSSNKAKKLKANVVKDCEDVVLGMDDYEEVTDEFNGIQIWWTSSKKIPKQQALFSYRGDEDNSFYRLTCRREHRDIITNVYLKHVLDEGKAIEVRTRQRKLYTNKKSENWYGYKRTMWSHILFEHLLPLILLQWTRKRRRISWMILSSLASQNTITKRWVSHGSVVIFFMVHQELGSRTPNVYKTEKLDK